MNTLVQSAYASVVRTSRGMSIAGTRITLYNILDYLNADWTPQLIQKWLDLTDPQITDAINYLQEHRDEIEKEYEQVLKRARENRKYWEARKQAHLAQRRTSQLTPEQLALRAKFQTWRSKVKTA